MDCIFCKIVKGELPSYIVYEDDKVFAFFDVLPISPGHTVVIPKNHATDVESISDEDLSAMIVAVKRIGKAMMSGLGVKGYSIFLDNKSAANQHVPHIHFHVVPRQEGDGLGRWPQGGYVSREAEEYHKKIVNKI
jgi:histidine triad (HIT) family protein